MKHKHLLMGLIQRMIELNGKGMSNYDVLMNNVSDEIQDLAQAYGEMLAVNQCLRALDKLKEGKKIMEKYFILFAWDIILRDMGYLLVNELICPVVAKKLHLEYNSLIK